MTWLLITLVTAFSLASTDALCKKALGSTDELVIVWVREGYALPFLVVGLIFVPIPTIGSDFFYALAVLVPLEIAALILYVKAIRISPLSLTIPFMALSPVFILLIAYVVLGEEPTPIALVGVVLTALGAYLLNAGATRVGPLGPIKAILKEKGSMLMIAVALLYSITSTIGKVAVINSSPMFFAFFYPLILTLVLSPLLIYKGKFSQVFKKPRTFIPIGILTAIMITTHFFAITMTDVAYMIAVKRTSLLFSVLYGYFLFEEEKIKERFTGSVVMIAGVVLIVFQ